MAKFAVFIPSLAGGGAERVAVTLANEFAQLGHETHLVVGTTLPSKYQDEVHELVNVHLIGASRVLFAIPKLATFVRKVQPEAIISIMAYASVAMKLAVVLSGKKNTKLYTREAISNEFKEENKDGTYTPLFVKLVAWSYNTSNGIVSPSKALTESLRRTYPNQRNIVHINSPVITDTFLKLEKSALPELPWSNDSSKLIVSAGRLSDQKDFKTLIEAFKIVNAKIDCKLIILGEGPDRTALELQIKNSNLKDHCYLPGFVENPLPYFKHADLFVLSSKYEGLPNVLIQALACGAKVVSTDCPTGPAEILDNGRHGKLVEVGNSETMATAMYESITNPDHTEQQRIAALVKNTYWGPFVSEMFAQFMQQPRNSNKAESATPNTL